eukprot:scaffold15198_cov28-Tisochrysis_lutea.AAC.2
MKGGHSSAPFAIGGLELALAGGGARAAAARFPRARMGGAAQLHPHPPALSMCPALLRCCSRPHGRRECDSRSRCPSVPHGPGERYGAGQAYHGGGRSSWAHRRSRKHIHTRRVHRWLPVELGAATPANSQVRCARCKGNPAKLCKRGLAGGSKLTEHLASTTSTCMRSSPSTVTPPPSLLEPSMVSSSDRTRRRLVETLHGPQTSNPRYAHSSQNSACNL